MTYDPFADEPPHRAPAPEVIPIPPCPVCGQAHDHPTPICRRDNITGQDT